MDDIKSKLVEIATTQKIQTELLKEHAQILKDQGKVLIRNTAIVDEHHKRSLLLEQEVRRVDEDIHLIQKHVNKVEGAGSLIRWLGYITGTLLGIGGVFKLLGIF